MSDNHEELRSFINDRINTLGGKIDEIDKLIRKDHDMLILSDRISKENKNDLNKLWSFSRKMNVKLIYISICTVLIACGGQALVLKVLGGVL